MPDYYVPSNYDEADFDFSEVGYSPLPADAADFDFALAVYNVLAGSSNIFTAIWADPNTSRTSGKMYALSWGPGAGLSVLELSTKVPYDFYTETESGRVDETLIDNNTRDLNIRGL